VEELSAKVEAMRGTVSDAVHLTPAELRLFPYLATQLSFREISESLFLSIHTIKAEVTSIYRKLGVSSRTQALERAREIGLVPPPEDELGE
jgi:LuxR family maltose regulon positive regulatory protein